MASDLTLSLAAMAATIAVGAVRHHGTGSTGVRLGHLARSRSATG